MSLFLNLLATLVPAALPAIPPATPLIICPASELPKAVLTPEATPEPIEAPNIDTPAPINPAVPPKTNASPAEVAPPVNDTESCPSVTPTSVEFPVGVLGVTLFDVVFVLFRLALFSCISPLLIGIMP
jgi:hypothetical protein